MWRWAGLFLLVSLSGCSTFAGQSAANEPSEEATSSMKGAVSQEADDEETRDLPYERSYASNPAVQAFIREMVARHQFDHDALDHAFAQIAHKPKVVEKSDNQPEVLVPFHQYRQRFVEPSRIALGRRFAKENAAWLTKAEAEFGVPGHVVVSILGVETLYGRITGKNRAFSSLTTLAFDYPRRGSYFAKELEAYLLLARQEGWTIGETNSSYSGALGMVQFMPSNYMRLALDYDQDGHIDLWYSPADAIGSVANYLRHNGWQRNTAIVLPALLNQATVNAELLEPWVNKGRSPEKEIADWGALGIEVLAPASEGKTGLIRLRTDENEVSYWLAYQNFFALMSYNPSRRYAMSVYDLAMEIKEDG